MTTTDDLRVVDLDPGELGIDLTSDGADAGLPVVAVHGEIDAATAPRLIACLDAVAAHRPATITIDLSGVDFMDSSGVNAIIDLRTRTAAWHGRVVVTGVRPRVRRVCEITGVPLT